MNQLQASYSGLLEAIKTMSNLYRILLIVGFLGIGVGVYAQSKVLVSLSMILYCAIIGKLSFVGVQFARNKL